MLMRKLGRTGLKVAALCLGGNTFGWTTDQKASEAVLDAYVEAGGNFIDTADVYSRWAPGNEGGESEVALGLWLAARKHRASVLIATKVMGPMGSGPNDSGLSRTHIMEGVEASLQRLKTDYIDLYQAHWDDKETPLQETLRAFDDLVRQGKVRYLGCSNYQAWRLTRALWESDRHGYARYECLQPKYNLVIRDEYERELEPLCLEQGVGVIPYSSLASGFLSGPYRPRKALPKPAAAVCAACQGEKPAANRFCHHWGAALAAKLDPARAPPPNQFASPTVYTPKHLAEKILTTASALKGERKQVTVLFVDVSGFTALSAGLDPEEVHRLMSRAFDLMLAEVHRYEGTVNQFLGDGIMSLFGAPIAHEDHARRAVHAALGIARALDAYQAELRSRGITFRVRQGLNTGLVVVGSIGSDLRMDYTALGDTTNVAARMQQVGEPGRVTISEATHRLVHGYFGTRALGEKQLKGKVEPMPAWEVVTAREARTRLDVEVEHGLTPLVGRERELGQLLDAFARARSGEGQAVFVVGEPGIGKSRLLLELRHRVGPLGDWHEGHCLSFGKAMTFHPLVDLIRRWFGVEESDGETAIAAKIERGVAEIGTDLGPVTPYLRALLSVDPGDDGVRAMSPVERHSEILDALRRLLVRAAERQPQILVIEDLHWIDSASEQFLATLVDSVPAARALLVLTYRPGYPNPFGDRSYFTRIVPAPLSADDSARMAAAVLATDTLPAELRALVAAKAEGNPFYVEELVKSLEEGGVLRRADGRAAPY